MAGSVPFDRAAEFYDRTRAISEASMARNVELLRSELGGRDTALEVGVGTGLLALRLHDGGVPLVGLDLSAPMLRKLVEKASGRAPFPLVLADATRMPFADASFGCAYLRWVLHLIREWELAVAEVVRVVRPGGVVLVNLGAYGGERAQIQERFAELVGASITPAGLPWADFDSLDGAMQRLGAVPRSLPEVHEELVDSIEEFLQGIEEGRFSWTWGVDDAVRLRALEDLRPWASERFGRLDEPKPSVQATRWRAYDMS